MGYLYSALILGSWLIPLHILPWVGWHQEVMSFSLVLLLGWHTLILSRHSKGVPVPKSTLILAMGAVIVFVQWIGHQIAFGGDALVLGFYLSLVAVCFSAGFSVSRQGNYTLTALSGFALVLLSGALTSVVIAFVQAFDVWESVSMINRMASIRRPGGNLGQPNHLATLLLMGVASLVYLFETKKCGKTLASFCFAVLICGMAVTESRTGLLSFLLMAVWWLARRRSVAFSVSPFIALLGCASVLLLLWVWPQFLAYVHSGGLPGGDVAKINTGAGTRLIVWPQLIEAVFQKPWFGWGLREVSAAHNAVLHEYAVGEPFTYAHNIILDMAIGIGLPLTVWFTWITTTWLWQRVRETRSLLPWYCTALMLPLGVHSMLEFPFAYAYLLVPVMFAIGVLEGTLFPRRVFEVNWWIAAGALSVVTATMAWSVVEYIVVEEDFRVARFEALHMGKTPSEYVRPQIYLLTQLDALLEGARIVPTPGMSPERIELARKVAMRYPWTATQNRYALSLALNGNAEEAIRQLQVMRAMHGEKMYGDIKTNWSELADTRYPQLKLLTLP
ncbi:PglL family O-oligosaccharyltransferase [Rhodoferax sp.]|uniref:PglL family O-oligosaccharyltransferase n=1 Tax=Rhodoferax sp. TaxID=50421 RepID=UPI0027233E5E|nr:O-antigen ligase family protein [Rhodoferax sp.]MDO9199031.1 Wzy polymerase domain-containing protein [Rhodoferax sp.]